MSASHKLAVLAIAHAALFAGCAVQVGPAEDEIDVERNAIEDATQEPSPEAPSPDWFEGHEGVQVAWVEQWLHFVDLGTGEPIEALTVCDPAPDAASVETCAETDRGGDVITHWTIAEERYHMLGTLPDGTDFMLTELAATDLINRLLRPIAVMTQAELEVSYAAADVKVEAGRHTVLARARTGQAPAEGVRFTLHTIDCGGVLTEDGCTREAVADGEDDATQSLSASLGHGLFLDVAPGMYELRGERDGVACSHAEVWLDGETGQVLAPELTCE